MLPSVCWYRRREEAPGATSSEKNILVLLPREKAQGTRKTTKEEKYLIKECRWERQQRIERDKRKGDGGGTQRVPERTK